MQFGRKSNDKQLINSLQNQVDAIHRSQAVIQFELDGTITTANENFCQAMGYQLSEIQGQHHRMFVDRDYANSQEYREFWQRLGRGEFFVDEFKRVAKGGREIWIQASYNPLLDEHGTPYAVVKFASDITEQKLQQIEAAGQIAAISRSQAVIEFETDGTIINANDNFCATVGYSLDEIKGQHHRMFVDPSQVAGAEYQSFWARLAAGEYFSGEFRRVGKGGHEIWIQASYNPILGPDGKPFKVIKYASDITQQKLQSVEHEGQMEAISRSQAVIEFETDGTIITANENFCATVGYSLDEIVGKHHRMFMDPTEAAGAAYGDFWAKLAKGEFFSGQYKRRHKSGSDVWIQASYNPIFDPDGKPFKVVKYASDTTERKLQNVDFAGQIDAIKRSQAVIEFRLDGSIVDANENFCSTVGYSLDEIRGKHHSMFVDPEYGASGEYKAFWDQLNRGEFISGEFHRIGKGGKSVWIQASYNPIMDVDGKPCKVVKYASDITAQKELSEEVARLMDEAGLVIAGMAEGDLTQRMEGSYSAQFESMKLNLNECVDSLTSTINQIHEASANILQSSGEIAQGNTHLSDRTEAQAAKLEEAASAMEELNGTVRNTAENSKQANELSNGAQETAQQGGAVVQQAIDAMSVIENSSKEISDIIGVIEEIAFQTNLLALNAAVEAARAGEQGRGFAVVASEVRNLAQRSSTSAKEITALIKDSVEKVSEGSKLVNQSGENLTQIISAVQSVSQIMDEIAIASEQQSVGISDVTEAVQSMDQMTQQNAAMVEEAAAASQSMAEDASSMQQRLGFFRLSGSGGVDKHAVASALGKDTKPVAATPVDVPKASAPAPAPVPTQVTEEPGDWQEF